MSHKYLLVKGAREHNLKNIDVKIPRDKLVVITGLSGSGKSSLAFDTIYAEGQRRYVESLSAYARQFLQLMEKPDVEYIEGLSPAISIEQKTTSKNPRSTVGTVTEIYDYLRLLFARVGKPHCHKCGKPISSQTIDEMVQKIMELEAGTRIQLLAPVIKGRKGEYKHVFIDIQREGFVRVRVDGKVYPLEEVPPLDKKKKHDIDIVVDRLVLKEGLRQRLADSLETCLKMGEGTVYVEEVGAKGKQHVFSEKMSCVDCGISLLELSPRMFSFNNPYGACPECSGIGVRMVIDPDLVVPDKRRSLLSGALAPWSGNFKTYYFAMLRSLADHYGFRLDVPFKQLKEEHRKLVLYGTSEKIKMHYSSTNTEYQHQGRYEGVIPNLTRRYRETASERMRTEIGRYMNVLPCPECQGKRLRPESLSVLVDGHNIVKVSEFSIKEAIVFFERLELKEQDLMIADKILKEVKERLTFLANVGLEYLTLDRQAGSLSGGEAQRIRLATQIGSSLMGVLYILDEPSIGLHQRDNQRLLDTLFRLRDLGNTVVVVEHDEETIRAADHIVDLGPAAGEFGGEVVVSGPLSKVLKCEKSLTGKYLRGDISIKIPGKRRVGQHNLTVHGAQENNLKNITVQFPLGVFNCVTGVSGSGKSTLVNEILYKALSRELYHSLRKPGKHKEIKGLGYIDKVIAITQKPIGRTPRSNPATYTKVFDQIRALFANLPASKIRGYQPGRFSFNVKGGRCEACSGDGLIKIEMHFLPDVYVTCEVCKGKRYNHETLEVKYRGKNIADVLNLTITEAHSFFQNIPKITVILETLEDVGLGYIRLGQPATTLSGGEAQRIKLAAELSRKGTTRTLYILDEPTTGLHFADIERLLTVLNRLTDAGNTIIVIEHNLEVIKTADHIIDLGPEGGDGGGEVIAQGSPEQLAKVKQSFTGQYLKNIFDGMKVA